MNICNKFKFWPFERSVLDEFSYLKNKPPTNEDALLCYYSIHESMQFATKKQSTQRDAAKQTVKEIIAWWVKAGYLCQSENLLIKKLLNLHKSCKSLS